MEQLGSTKRSFDEQKRELMEKDEKLITLENTNMQLAEENSIVRNALMSIGSTRNSRRNSEASLSSYFEDDFDFDKFTGSLPSSMRSAYLSRNGSRTDLPSMSDMDTEPSIRHPEFTKSDDEESK